MLRGDQSLPVLGSLCLSVAGHAGKSSFTTGPLDEQQGPEVEGLGNRAKLASELADRIGWVRRPKPASPTTPWGSYVRG